MIKGYISKVDESHGQLIVDVGVFEPKVVQATISHVTLRDQFSAPAKKQHWAKSLKHMHLLRVCRSA